MATKCIAYIELGALEARTHAIAHFWDDTMPTFMIQSFSGPKRGDTSLVNDLDGDNGGSAAIDDTAAMDETIAMDESTAMDDGNDNTEQQPPPKPGSALHRKPHPFYKCDFRMDKCYYRGEKDIWSNMMAKNARRMSPPTYLLY